MPVPKIQQIPIMAEMSPMREFVAWNSCTKKAGTKRKMMFQEIDRGTDARRTYDFPRFFNLYNDPKEEYPLTKATAGHFWVRWPMAEILNAHGKSLQEEPPISSGTPDPYTPKK